MVRNPRRLFTENLDGLRLIALGRIPRCASCPRYHALVDTHDGRRLSRSALPRVPKDCHHEVCAPLVHRLDRAGARRAPLVASAS